MRQHRLKTCATQLPFIAIIHLYTNKDFCPEKEGGQGPPYASTLFFMIYLSMKLQ